MDSNHETWLIDHAVIRTDDPSEFQLNFSTFEGDIQLAKSNDRHPVFELRRARLGRIEIGLYFGNAEWTAKSRQSNLSAYLLQFSLSGSFRVDDVTRGVTVFPGQAVLIGPSRMVCRTSFPGSSIIFRIPVELMYSRAEVLLGPFAPRNLNFELSIDRNTSGILLRYAMLVVQAIDSGGLEPDCSVARVFENGLVELLLEHHPLSNSKRPATIDSRGRLAVIDAVKIFVDQNLGENLTLDKLAQAADCNERALQIIFSELRRMTPIEYVRSRRLAMAKKLLEAGESGVTVSMIAMKCGMNQFGRFSAYYRDAFGELPSETWNRAQSRRSKRTGGPDSIESP